MNTDVVHPPGSDRRRRLALAVSVPALLSALSSCSVLPGSSTVTVSGSAAPAGLAANTSPAKSPATSPAASGTGCPDNGVTVPAGANRATTADLDGDGKADTLWLADLEDSRVLGVSTASGAGFSTTFSSASTDRATAHGGRVSGGAIVLLDVAGISQRLYAVADCSIVPTRNAEGRPWEFGFDQEGGRGRTGAGCITIGSTRRLVAYRATGTSGGARFDVTRATVTLSRGGRRAVAGDPVTLGRSLRADSALVGTAGSVSCGSSKAVIEPS